MGISELKEIVNQFKVSLNVIVSWSFDDWKKRVLVITITQVVIAILFVNVIERESNIFIDKLKNQKKERELLIKEKSLNYLKDLIELCINSKNDKNKISTFYCDYSIEQFRFVLKYKWKSGYDLFLEKKAYEGILVILKNEIRTLKYNSLIQNIDDKKPWLIEFASKPSGKIAFILVNLCLVVIWLLLCRRKQQLEEK